mmetsp:Transcript_5776/g.35874  ORF Transcript_5776/g.35874 Transcript_5776/m.35874 type:complete len:892 (+) Transcript_5776:734-3409(+)
MPKRRRGASAPDFRKLKRKVGKRIPKSANEVKLDLKVKHVHMPVQRMLQDEDDEGGGAAKYTFEQLLARTRHTNAHARREAVESLADTIARKPELLRLRLKEVVEALAERMADSEAHVRKAMNNVFEHTVLSNVDEKAMAPFLPLLVAHIAAAMTDIHRSVRLAALPVVEMLVRHSSRNLVRFATPFLEQYNDMLTRGYRAKSVSAQNVESILRACESLDVFVDGLEQSLHPPAEKDNPSENSIQFDEFKDVIAPDRWKRKGSVYSERSFSQASTSGPHGNTCASAQDAWLTLGASLLDCWMECTPSEVCTAPNHLHIESLECISRLLSRIVRIQRNISMESITHASNGKQRGQLPPLDSFCRSILQRVIAYFPFAYPEVVVTGEILEAMCRLNASMADLLCSLVCISTRLLDEPWKEKLFRFFPALASFYCDALSSGQLLKSDTTAGPTEFKASAETLRAAQQSLFGNFEDILKFCHAHDYHLLLKNTTALLEAQHSCRGSLLGCMEAINILTSPSHAILYGISDWHVRWAQQMPRIAVNFESKERKVSSLAVEIMSKIVRWIPSDHLSGMEHVLCSLFVSHTANTSAVGMRAEAGPIAGLSPASQMQVIDALYYLPTFSKESFKLLATFCLMQSTPSSLALRLLNVLKLKEGDLEPNLYVSFLFTLLIGRVQDTILNYRWNHDSGSCSKPGIGWGEESTMVQAASSNMAGFLGFSKIAALMEPQLLDCVCKDAERRKIMGILSACSAASKGVGMEEEGPSKSFVSSLARVLPWYCTSVPDASTLCRELLMRFDMVDAFYRSCTSLRISNDDPEGVERSIGTLASIFQDVAEDASLRSRLIEHKDIVLAAHKHWEDQVACLGVGTAAAARCQALLSRSLASSSVAMGRLP